MCLLILEKIIIFYSSIHILKKLKVRSPYLLSTPNNPIHLTMFLVTYITRTQSSGFESRNNKVFDTLEKAAEYIKGEWFDSLCEINDYPIEWDDDDLGRPMPTRDEFSLEAIVKLRSGKFKSNVLFAPYSQYAGLITNELHLEEVHM